MTISPNGINFICQHEGFKAHPYQDVKGVWTIGYGTTLYPNGLKVTAHDVAITPAQAMDCLRYHVDTFVKAELQSLKLTQNQYDSLASLVYNIGISAWSKSTVRKCIVQGDTEANIRAGFMMWVKSGGATIKGLVARRKDEADLYFTA